MFSVNIYRYVGSGAAMTILLGVLAVLIIVAFGVLAILIGLGRHDERDDYYDGGRDT